jgi:hypothetical protein
VCVRVCFPCSDIFLSSSSIAQMVRPESSMKVAVLCTSSLAHSDILELILVLILFVFIVASIFLKQYSQICHIQSPRGPKLVAIEYKCPFRTDCFYR